MTAAAFPPFGGRGWVCILRDLIRFVGFLDVGDYQGKYVKSEAPLQIFAEFLKWHS